MVTVGEGVAVATGVVVVAVLIVELWSAELVGPGDSGGFASVLFVAGAFMETDDGFVLFLFVDGLFAV